MEIKLCEIAELVGGQLTGDGEILITGFSGIKEAKEGDLTFLDNVKYLPMVAQTKASAILASEKIDDIAIPVILVKNPSFSFTQIVGKYILKECKLSDGIHPSALVSDSAEIGRGVAIGPCAIISDHAKVGKKTRIYPGCFIGNDVTIGENCTIYPNVTVMHSLSIGNNVIIHSGTVIGSDGFGFLQVEGKHKKIPQIGTVVIEDDVEIGANVTVDRARFDKTLIGRGTKIDNLVQIAHNVVMGEDCIIISQVGISGSVNIGKGAILAGQVGVVGHLSIGDGVIVASRGVVTKSIPAHTKVSGNPAKEDSKAKKIQASVQRLPHYVKVISELEKRVAALEQRILVKDVEKGRK